MFQNLFNIILSTLASLIQIVLIPINALINVTLPNISGKISELGTNLSLLFTGIGWGLGVVPPVVLATLLFIISVEIARHTIFISTHIISLILDLIQRIKFW